MTIRSRIRAFVDQSRVDPAERYLNESTSIADLEMREREIARGRFTQRRRFL